MRSILFVLISFVILISICAESFETKDSQFHKYWYQGKAELTRYALEQARYGEIHKGDAVLIFVTEPFLTDKQVKYEFGDRSNATSVLKLNLTKKFFTGIYPYSVMTSIFAPVDPNQHALKVTSSTQEWCGNTFMQLNLRNGQYRGLMRSYFQAEGDQNFDLKAVWTEDEIWTRIRIAPETLPVGEVEMIPGLQYVRLGHVDYKPVKVTASRSALPDGLTSYTLEYKNWKRKLTIRFQNQFPYSILSWEESAPGGFGTDTPILTTKAVKTNSLLLDYWDKHGNEDAGYRKQLGITEK